MMLALTGCGPSRSQRANERVDQLTRQAATLFKLGQIDDAQRTIDAALAVEGATRRDEAVALAGQIGAKRRQVDTEQFDRQAAGALEQAVALNEEGNAAEAVRLVARSVPRSSDIQQELADALVHRVEQLAADATAMRYWETFDLAALVDFREKDRLPDDWQSTVDAGPPHGDALRRLRQTTLRRTLPEALAEAERRAERLAHPDNALPSPTIEEVAADPESWIDKDVRFDRVWIGGEIITSLKQGRLLTVTSPAGNVYKPYIEKGALVFSTYGAVAKRLESFVAPDERVEGRLFCKIVRARRTGTVSTTSFYRAMVSKVELYEEPPERNQRNQSP
ncbi:MAG: hypothetical protein JW719_06320 [Pirellulales bacterium]|nr:hypothetical protein [Pirellulales bacterium]